jgi:hypothetical protein
MRIMKFAYDLQKYRRLQPVEWMVGSLMYHICQYRFPSICIIIQLQSPDYDFEI